MTHSGVLVPIGLVQEVVHDDAHDGSRLLKLPVEGKGYVISGDRDGQVDWLVDALVQPMRMVGQSPGASLFLGSNVVLVRVRVRVG